MPHDAIYLPEEASIVRVVFRVWFILTLLSITVIGDYCCGLRNQLRLLRGQKASLNEMTGWISGVKSFSYFGKLRCLPGAWLGLLMMIVAVIGSVADIAGSAFITSTFVEGRCSFQNGLVLSKDTVAMYPSVFTSAYQWAYSAQYTSWANCGRWGIFQKADNSTNFCASQEDLLAYWNCVPNGDRQFLSNMSDLSIAADLYQRGYLYNYSWHYNVSYQDRPQTPENSRQLLILSLSPSYQHPNRSRTARWDMKFAVGMTDKQDTFGSKFMQCYDCSVVSERDDDEFITYIMSWMYLERQMSDYLSVLHGGIYGDLDVLNATTNPASVIQTVLNNLIMVAGSGNSNLRQSTDEIGCLKKKTKVPILMLAIASCVGLQMIYMAGYFIYLCISIWIVRRKYDRMNDGTRVSSKELLKSVPNGLLDWMVHATRESSQVAIHPRPHQMKRWMLSTRHHRGERLGVVQDHQSDSHPLLSATPTDSEATLTSDQHFRSPSFLGQKTEYSIVRTQEIH